MERLSRLLIPAIIMAGFLSACKEDPVPGPVTPSQPSFSLKDFATAEACSSCHPQYYNEWKGSMHRYSANDPIWGLANNILQSSTQGVLKDFCWQCHSPVGFLAESTPETFNIPDLPDIVREGVTCVACHTLRAPHTTTNQRINYNIDPRSAMLGTIADPVPTAAHQVEYDPTFSRSEKCRECHDLIINNVPVEMTFTEWQNSPWGAMSVECQDCHMQRYTGQAAIGGPVRDNLHRHDLVGVDVAMTDFPNKIQQKGIVDSLLKNSATVTVTVPSSAALGETVYVDVKVYNDKTGHNLPTSVFFFRQMWIEVFAWDNVDTAYRSGHRDASGDLLDGNSEINPGGDPDLVLFSGTLYKEGEPTNVFELDSLVNNSIPPFGTGVGQYRFPLPRAGTWTVRARLLFRPFAPYLFRALGAEQYLSELPTFEMNVATSTITVQ